MKKLSNVKGKKKVVLKFNLDDLKNMKSIDDFFIITGIVPYLKDKTIHDVRQMDMNSKDGEAILNYWMSNWKKIKECKGCKEKYAKSKIAFTWMNYAPCYNSRCKHGEIFLYPKKAEEEK